MTGLQISVKQFFIFLLTIFITSMFASGMCFFIAATIPIFGKCWIFDLSNIYFYFVAVALIIAILIFIIMMIFGGFMVDLSSIFNWLSWIQWISVFRYASNMLAINEFRNITFCLSNMTSVCPMTGIDVLEQKKIDYKTDWDMWTNFFAIAIMALAYFILAFIQLLRMKKAK
jgi:ATP-binding cassette subfamily G (WHITE) protein 2